MRFGFGFGFNTGARKIFGAISKAKGFVVASIAKIFHQVEATVVGEGIVVAPLHVSVKLQAVITGEGTVEAQLPSYDADSLAFFTATGITDPDIMSAIDNLVVGYKNLGIWSKRAAIYPFVGGSPATHKFNLKDPRNLDIAYRLDFFGGFTHTSTGILPNGTNAYANTHFTPSVNAAADAGGLGYYSRTNDSATSIDIGAYGGGGENDIYIRYTGNSFYLWNNTGSGTATPNSDSSGWYAVNRTSTKQSGWKGATKVLDEAISAGASSYPVFLCAANGAGAAAYFSTRECAFAVLGGFALTDGEMADEYNLIQDFQTALGREV